MGNSDRFRRTGFWLLSHQAGGCEDAASLAKAGARVLDQLEQGLSPLIGQRGARLLLTRAWQTARAQHTFLGTSPGSLEAEGTLEELAAQVDGLDPAQVRDGITAVVANALALLSDFIGEGLVTRQVRRIWPELPRAKIPTDEEVGDESI